MPARARIRTPHGALGAAIAAALAAAFALVSTAALPAPAAAPATSSDHNAHTFTDPVAKRWWATITALADDSMRGRQTGSAEHLKAAHMMADQFKALGLVPGGANGTYLQSVPFTARRVREPECALTLAFADHDVPLVLGEDATLQMSIASADTIDAPAVFVGYGLSVPEQGFDEIGGVDLKGKIAVFVQGTPSGVTEPRRAQAKSSEARWGALKRAGAIGAMTIRVPGKDDIPWARSAKNRFQVAMVLADPDLDDRAGQQIGVNVNAERFDKLLAGTGHTAQELFTLADSGAKLPSFPLAARVHARVRYDQWAVESQNVVGVLPGADPKLKDEFVLVTAHLDHLGVGVPTDGDSIYNGAMDNASGVASILEVARTLAARKGAARPKRSIAFVCVTGEEKGLLGSHYFARRPTVPAAGIVADVNVDMVLPILPFRHTVVEGVDESDLGDFARAAAKEMNVEVIPDPDPDRNIFIRSDQYSFIREGVPGVAFDNAAAKGTPDYDVFKGWIHSRYHQVGDDLDQPLDPTAPAAIIDFATRIVTTAANRPARPAWKDASFFRRFASAH
jgi:Zn-dependent M28 family amino/carboxypeptidase